MRVRGSKRRVRLTEVELEPSEQRPMLRVAPAAASLIWLGSMGLATAIYLEWLPVRALFEADTSTASGQPTRSERRPSRRPAVSPQPRVEPAQVASPPISHASPAPTQTSPAPPDTTISTPKDVPESSRTIRGSYYSEDSSWAAGW